jgi:DNA-binding CsgD family transcriptional regulator
LRLLGETCYRLGDVDHAQRFLRQAVSAAAGDAPSIANAEIAFAFTLLNSLGSFQEADDAARRALALAAPADEDSVPTASALALSVVTGLMVGGRLDEERLERALALEDPQQAIPVERRPSFVAGVAWIHDEQLVRARTVLEGLCARLSDRGEESDLPQPLLYLALLECFGGSLARAGQHADRGYELARQSHSDSLVSQTAAMRAFVHAHQGRAEQTRDAAAEATELAARTRWRVGAFWASVAVGHLELSLGNPAAVVTALAPSIELVEERGVRETIVIPDPIEALVNLGELKRAERLTKQLDDRARALHRPVAKLAAARCRALIDAAGGDPQTALDRLDRTLADLPAIPFPLELARTLIVKGQLERRCKRKRQAVQTLDRAVGICEEIGATLWAQRANAELARMRRGPDPDELTATEARVAALAASGMTNREVAAAAFLSPKTVEANLSRVYRKLAIHSRAELGAWLAQRDHQPD